MAGDADRVIHLPAKLNILVATSLKEDISSQIGRDLRVDASGVSHIDAPCVQVLLTAYSKWTESEHKFTVSPISEPFRSDLTTLGLKDCPLLDEEVKL